MMVAGAFATQTYAAGFQLSEQSAIQILQVVKRSLKAQKRSRHFS